LKNTPSLFQENKTLCNLYLFN